MRAATTTTTTTTTQFTRTKTTILLTLLTFFTLLISPTNAQNFAYQQSNIDVNWLQSLGAFEPSEVATMRGPEFPFTIFGRQYSVLPSQGGSLHFGDAATLSQKQCCNDSCTTYCNLNSETQESQLAIYPLQFSVLPPSTTFTHSLFSNATVYAYRTTMHTSDYTISYAIVLISPSTVIIGLEPLRSGTAPSLLKTFSGFIGSTHSQFANSPVNDASLYSDALPSELFPNPLGYPSNKLISYASSQYSLGRAYSYCSIGGTTCAPSFFTDLTVPKLISLTTNSDAACYRTHNSGLLNGLLSNPINPIVPAPIIPGPQLQCLISFYLQEQDTTPTRSINVPSAYDRNTDTFQCSIPATASPGGAIDLTLYSFMVMRLTSVESTTTSTTNPYQPVPVWTPVNYANDFTQTTSLQLDSDPAHNIDAGNQAYRTYLTTTPPEDFPYPITSSSSCHCRFIRYRGTLEANPSSFKPVEYGLSVELQSSLHVDAPKPQAGYNTTITDRFYTTTDFCFSDCNNRSITSVSETGGYNNCGQCLTIQQALAVDSTAIANNQPLNCWKMCESLTTRNGGHFSYLMNYPLSARTNGLIMPNSPFHEVDTRNISPTPMSEEKVACATPIQQSATGVPVGFTTYRDHLSTTLDPVQWFKYISVAFCVAGIGFSLYLMIDLAKSRDRKRRRREEKNTQRRRTTANNNGGTSPNSGINNQPRPSGGLNADIDDDDGDGGDDINNGENNDTGSPVAATTTTTTPPTINIDATTTTTGQNIPLTPANRQSSMNNDSDDDNTTQQRTSRVTRQSAMGPGGLRQQQQQQQNGTGGNGGARRPARGVRAPRQGGQGGIAGTGRAPSGRSPSSN